jgi:hypothetical protein
MASIFYFSSRPDPLGFLSSSGHGIAIDPLAHIGEYAGLTALLHRALSNNRWGEGETGRQGENVTKACPEPAEGRSSPPLPVPLSPCLLFAFAYALFDELH